MDANMIKSFGELIRDVGFPVACTLLLLYFILYKFDKKLDQVVQLVTTLLTSSNDQSAANDQVLEVMKGMHNEMQVMKTDVGGVKSDTRLLLDRKP
jgi:hypothetical protein